MPHLSEEEKQRIVEEERIRAEARRQFAQPANSSQKQQLSRKQKRVLIGSILVLIAIPFALIYWYISVPLMLLAGLWFWNRITISKKNKFYVSGAIVVAFALIFGMQAYAKRTPSIEVLEPADNQEFQVENVVVKGRVTPKDAVVKIQGRGVSVNDDGVFDSNVNLQDESNVISIEAANDGKIANASVTVKRIFTEEEKAERERLAKERHEQWAKQQEETAAQRAKQAEEEAKAAAEKEKLRYASEADICAQMEVQARLKAPSTADFGSCAFDSCVKGLGDDKYTVNAYVDAQNSFGAQIRTNYSCQVQVLDPKAFRCLTTCQLSE